MFATIFYSKLIKKTNLKNLAGSVRAEVKGKKTLDL
jgi:hypothetical protein